MGNCKSTSSVAERAHEKGVLATIDLGATLEADGVCVPEGVSEPKLTVVAEDGEPPKSPLEAAVEEEDIYMTTGREVSREAEMVAARPLSRVNLRIEHDPAARSPPRASRRGRAAASREASEPLDEAVDGMGRPAAAAASSSPLSCGGCGSAADDEPKPALATPASSARRSARRTGRQVALVNEDASPAASSGRGSRYDEAVGPPCSPAVARAAESSLPLHRAAFEAYQARLGPLHPETLSAAHGLAMMLKNTQHYAEAEALLRATFEARKLKLGPADAATLETALELASLLWRSGLLEEAEPFLRVTHDARRAKLGPEHDQTLDAANDLALLLKQLGSMPEAEALYRATYATRRRRRGGDDELTINSAMSLALLLKQTSRYEEAEELYRRAYDARTRTLGAAHGQTRDTGRELSGVLARLGRIREANALKDKCQEENANPFSCYSAASAAETSPASRRNRERFAFATACYAPDGDVEIRGMPDFEADDP